MIVTLPTNMTVAEYCASMERHEIRVNKDYQRSDQVWPDVAKSFLIESILLGFPIPKIYLHSITDLKTRRTIKEIVDGQQRSRAINDYYMDKYSLSRQLETDDLKGLKYSELPEEWQSRFISYSISVDLILSAQPDEVVQIFRRMNSYTVPLNPEELRNAEFQGPFKWFILEESRKYDVALSALGVLSQKAQVRMQDLKLYTEILNAVVNGISTTNKRVLDALYRKFDKEFPRRDELAECLEFAFERICSMEFLTGSNLARPYMIYSLALALIHRIHPIPTFELGELAHDFGEASIEQRLLDLSAALDLDEDRARESPYRDFIAASSEKTNVKAQREMRVRWFINALHVAEG